MSDWQVGDLALCVDDSPCRCPCGGQTVSVRAGTIYRVEAVTRNRGPAGPFPTLILEGVEAAPSHDRGTNTARFRKIHPDEQDACEPEFVTLIKRVKQTEPASAWLERTGPIAKRLNAESKGDK